jgi:vancomycin permeability regulator SanA
VSLLRRHPIVTTVALVFLVGLILVGASAITVWRAAHTDDASRVDHADVIMVLGAAEYDGTPSPVFRGRLDHAVLLWQQGRADRVMVLGSNQPGDVTTEAEAGREYLISQGVPADSVTASPVGHTTLESLEAAAGYMRRNGLQSAFLVSDPWHNARVKRMASDLGIEGYASATWTSAARSEETRFGGYARETLAYLYYRIFGR